MNNPHGVSRLITWSGKLALLCLLLLPLSVLAVRLGMSFKIGLPVFALSSLLAMLTIVVLLGTCLVPRYRAHRGLAMKKMLPALPPAILMLSILGGTGDVPPIHDITTDTANPPEFVVALEQRGDNSNSLAIVPEVLALQQQHYPDLVTINSPLDSSGAFSRTTEVATTLNWEIYNSDPDAGILEAAATTFWFGFTDDIVVRISPAPSGTLIDVRSVSRVGVSDLGANAKRIREFVRLFPLG